MKNSKTLLLGTRGSQLAMWQSSWVKSQLEKNGHAVELVVLKTEGDIATGPLAQIGGQGLFTKRLQTALLENEVDLAVHSLKDLPTRCPPELAIAAVPPRESVFDALVCNHYDSLDHLPAGARVGTGSVRRGAQLKHIRPDLTILDLRGNVDTRLSKLDNGQYDAIVLACAGLIRLGQAERISYRFTPNELLPAVGQGALGIETRADDSATIQAVIELDDAVSHSQTIAERRLLSSLDAGCMAPIGALTTIVGPDIEMTAAVLSADGQERIHCSESLPLANAADLGVRVAEKLIGLGAERLLGR